MHHVGSLLLGLGNGGVYAALALALVLTYRSSGVINFATGAVAMYVAYSYAFLRNGELLVLIPGLPTSVDLGTELGFVPALLLALVIGSLLGAVLYLVVFRPLRESPPLARAVASLGVLVVIQSVMAIRVGTSPVSVEAIFPTDRWQSGSLTVLADRFYLAVTVVVLTIVLAALFRFTRFGLFTRAAAESQTGAYVSGISPDRVSLYNWMISGTVAGAAGILIAPLSPLSPSTYTLFVVPALAAAVVGGFQGLVSTVLAGLVIGMVQSEALTLSADHSWLPGSGASALVPLLVILIALLVTGRGIPVRSGLVRQPLGRAPRPRSLTLPTVSGAAIGVIALLLTSGTWRAAVIGTFIAAILGLSLVVVTGFAGQVSLAQLALAGASAFSLSGLTHSWHIPFPFAPLLAALVATVLGVVIGLPALRLRGLTLGIVTLALAYAIEAVWFRNSDLVGSSGAKVSDPSLFGWNIGIGSGEAFPRLPFGILCLLVLVAVAWGVAKLRMSSLGSAMLAVRANERSAAGIGVNVVRVKLIAFALASFIAGLGGALLAYRSSVVTFDSFTAIGGLTLLSTAYLAGVTSVYGGITAGIMAGTGIVYIAMDRWIDFGDWFSVISGFGVILVLLTQPEGIASGGHDLVAQVRKRFGARKAATATTEGASASTADGAVPATVAASAAAGTATAQTSSTDAAAPAPVPAEQNAALLSGADRVPLDVEGVTVRYGGVVAVSDVSLRIAPGQIVGLIGPNGAGKTSAIDAITGFARASGTVRLGEERLDTLATHVRVKRGLARTFQSIELYDDLTVSENVSAALAGVQADHRHRTLAAALDLVGIADRADRAAGELSQGERQLVSIARAIATGPRVLLLDEPAAGLDTTESAWLGEKIRSISRSGVGILLVDHDVALVLDVCDHIYVLDFGKVIASGSPDEIRANRAVADAYLGNVHDGEGTESEPAEGGGAAGTGTETPAPAAPATASSAPAAPATAAPVATADAVAPAAEGAAGSETTVAKDETTVAKDVVAGGTAPATSTLDGKAPNSRSHEDGAGSSSSVGGEDAADGTVDSDATVVTS
ncbi:ATP-binding cassette domain-containing protein [Frankia sp. AgPm24]|uniref:branched-chain amino acid ABC transporter permease/ATP-binding protein n=1 Tax=Frankia sp. AgPm24 TaxID=631128 RepID=UPI00200ECABD|nr:branched-chain amino acid ABC transporter permease/ATP-binding protein [Frankia sp. AgPm24]MCK9925069.1 ATP-binding cassette domain-containing protein [Frankia sp. AgPm24]